MVEQTAGEGRRIAPMAYADAAGLDPVTRRAELEAYAADALVDIGARLEVLEELEGPAAWQSNEVRYLAMARVMGEVAREVAGVPAGRAVDRAVLRSQLVECGARVVGWIDWLDQQAAAEARQARLALGGVS